MDVHESYKLDEQNMERVLQQAGVFERTFCLEKDESDTVAELTLEA